MMEKQIVYKDITVNYEKQGKGEAVFFIHGFCEDHTMWEAIIPKLTKEYSILCPDLPGFGKSSLGNEPLSIVWMAEMIDFILRCEKIETCTIIGHSLGAYVGIHFAELYPDKIKALGFINSHVFDDGEEKRMNRKKSIEFIRNHTAKLFIRELINNLFSERFKKDHKDTVLALIKEAQLNITDEAVIANLQAMAARADKQDVLKKFRKPVLFLIGEEDATIPIEQSMRQVSFPMQSDIHVRQCVAHMSIYEDRAYSIEAIYSFLRRND